MRIDLADLRRHYASIPDGEFLAIHRDDLTEAAQSVYDEEVARRGLNEEDEPSGEEAVEVAEGEEPEFQEFEELDELMEEDGPAPEWLEDAASACAFVLYPGSPDAEKASNARAALRAAGIPSHITVTQEQQDDQSRIRDVVNVMVPGSLALHATAILDRDLFNEEHEAEWRTHLDALSDSDLQALDPKIFCSGLLDRVARMKRVYAEEMSQRKLRARPE